MTIRETIIAYFRKVGKRPVAGADIARAYPKFNPVVVRQECIYFATLGLLSSTMVDNQHHGRRNEYKASDELLGIGGCWPDTNEAIVERALSLAPAPLGVTDIRYSIYSLLGLKIRKAEIETALEGLMQGQRVVRDGDGRYQQGKTRDVPWVLLDGALRGVTLKASAR